MKKMVMSVEVSEDFNPDEWFGTLTLNRWIIPFTPDEAIKMYQDPMVFKCIGIRPIPEKKPEEPVGGMFNRGWNACLDTIFGVKE